MLNRTAVVLVLPILVVPFQAFAFTCSESHEEKSYGLTMEPDGGLGYGETGSKTITQYRVCNTEFRVCNIGRKTPLRFVRTRIDIHANVNGLGFMPARSGEVQGWQEVAPGACIKSTESEPTLNYIGFATKSGGAAVIPPEQISEPGMLLNNIGSAGDVHDCVRESGAFRHMQELSGEAGPCPAGFVSHRMSIVFSFLKYDGSESQIDVDADQEYSHEAHALQRPETRDRPFHLNKLAKIGDTGSKENVRHVQESTAESIGMAMQSLAAFMQGGITGMAQDARQRRDTGAMQKRRGIFAGLTPSEGWVDKDRQQVLQGLEDKKMVEKGEVPLDHEWVRTHDRYALMTSFQRGIYEIPKQYRQQVQSQVDQWEQQGHTIVQCQYGPYDTVRKSGFTKYFFWYKTQPDDYSLVDRLGENHPASIVPRHPVNCCPGTVAGAIAIGEGLAAQCADGSVALTEGTSVRPVRSEAQATVQKPATTSEKAAQSTPAMDRKTEQRMKSLFGIR